MERLPAACMKQSSGKNVWAKENHIFSPAYREDEFEEVLESCEHLVFNSFSQLECFGERAAKAGKVWGSV